MSEDNNVAAATLLIQKCFASLNKNVCLHVATSRSFPRGVRLEARTSVSLVQGMWRNMQLSFDLNMTQWVALLLDIYIEVENTSHTKEFSTAPCRAPIRDFRSVDSSHTGGPSVPVASAFPRPCQA